MSALSVRRNHSLQTVMIILALWLAFGVRLVEMHERNLWLDEAVEFNVAYRPIQEVIVTDRDSTHDPPLFSVILNLWMKIGRGDFHLRMLPVFASVLAVALMFNLGRLVHSPSVGWLGAIVAAVAPRAVYYGQEVNQYAFVSLLAVLCPLLAERYLKQATLGRLVPFVVAGAAAILLHYELALYLLAIAMVGTIYLCRNIWQGNRQSLFYWIIGLSILGCVGIGLLWYYALPQKARLPDTFAPVRFNSPVSVRNEIQTWLEQTVEIVSFLFWGYKPTALKWFTVAMLIVGGIVGVLPPTSRRIVVYFVTGLVVGYVAAGFGFLVYWDRYLWYAFPLCALLVCIGILGPFRKWPNRYLMLISASVAIVFVGLLVSYLPSVSGQPFLETEQLGDVVHHVEKYRQPGDVIYVYYGAGMAFKVYASQELFNAAIIENWVRHLPLVEQRAKMWAVMGGKPRAWILMTHVYEKEDSNLLDKLNKTCRQLDAIKSINAAGYLFDCMSVQ